MTLNITVATDRCIFQSADFRLTDMRTGQHTDNLATQKIAVVRRANWNATVCFAGVGRTATVNVSAWLDGRVSRIQYKDPLQRLLDELVSADAWLAEVSHPYNRHSFSVGAFVGDEPVFVLVSNFEKPSGSPSPIASSKLSVHEVRPREPIVFVTGQKKAVKRKDRQQLAVLASQMPEREEMYSALAHINQTAATTSDRISPECPTTCLTVAGEGGSRVHGIGNRPFFPAVLFPEALRASAIQHFDKMFGVGQWQAPQMVFATSNPSEEYHRSQLREKPNDAGTHCNFGAFLLGAKEDLDGAERASRKALEIDAKHVAAITNLGSLLGRRKRCAEAVQFFRRALELEPGNENATLAYAEFVGSTGDYHRVKEILASGLDVHPDSGRLLLLQAQTNLLDRMPQEALIGFERTRDASAEARQTEAGYATAMQLSGMPAGETIGAYRGAIALNDRDAGLKLNLAQLLFVAGQAHEAEQLLGEALRVGLSDSAQIEAQFYMLCHTSEPATRTIQAIKLLLARGTRLDWDVKSNIDTVRMVNLRRAASLEKIAEVMKGTGSLGVLDDPVVLAAF